LLLGEERLLRQRVLQALRSAVTAGGIAGFNEDEFSAAEAPIGSILAAVRTLPMLAKRRWVMVRDLERWETKASKDEDEASPAQDSPAAGALDRLAEYAAAPAESTVLVLFASQLNAKRRLVTLAKKQGFLVACDALTKSELPGWVQAAAERRGHAMSRGVAELLAEVLGPDLSSLEDAVERLSLFAGPGQPISEQTVTDLIPIVRPATVWELLDALGQRQRGQVLSLLDRVYDPQDRGLRLVGLLAWSARQMLRFEAALAAGASGAEAAKQAGIPPFRARAAEQQVRRFSRATLEQWLLRLRDVDLDLKGGSKRPPRATLESALIQLCGQ
jgi:DNA polymerase-3 subunit delta